jgi:hypothetical protein
LKLKKHAFYKLSTFLVQILKFLKSALGFFLKNSWLNLKKWQKINKVCLRRSFLSLKKAKRKFHDNQIIFTKLRKNICVQNVSGTAPAWLTGYAFKNQSNPKITKIIINYFKHWVQCFWYKKRHEGPILKENQIHSQLTSSRFKKPFKYDENESKRSWVRISVGPINYFSDKIHHKT